MAARRPPTAYAGTAFVQYHTKEGADSALSAASASDSHSATALPAGNVTSRDPRERKRAVIAGAVRSALSDGGVKIGSRVIMISRAVNKDEAAKLAEGACGGSNAQPALASVCGLSCTCPVAHLSLPPYCVPP